MEMNRKRNSPEEEEEEKPYKKNKNYNNITVTGNNNHIHNNIGSVTQGNEIPCKEARERLVLPSHYTTGLFYDQQTGQKIPQKLNKFPNHLLVQMRKETATKEQKIDGRSFLKEEVLHGMPTYWNPNINHTNIAFVDANFEIDPSVFSKFIKSNSLSWGWQLRRTRTVDSEITFLKGRDLLSKVLSGFNELTLKITDKEYFTSSQLDEMWKDFLKEYPPQLQQSFTPQDRSDFKILAEATADSLYATELGKNCVLLSGNYGLLLSHPLPVNTVFQKWMGRPPLPVVTPKEFAAQHGLEQLKNLLRCSYCRGFGHMESSHDKNNEALTITNCDWCGGWGHNMESCFSRTLCELEERNV